MHSFKARFIVFFGLFTLLSCVAIAVIAGVWGRYRVHTFCVTSKTSVCVQYGFARDFCAEHSDSDDDCRLLHRRNYVA